MASRRCSPIWRVRSSDGRSLARQSEASSGEPGLVAKLEATPQERRREVLRDTIRGRLLRVLGLDPQQPVALDLGLTDLGMDSLMAVELANRLGVLVDRSLPATLAFEYPTLAQLADYLEGLLSDRVTFDADDGAGPDGDGPGGGPSGGPGGEPDPGTVDELSEDELEQELLKELDASGY